MKIAICDDEKIICDQIEKLVKRQAPDCDTMLFGSGEELLRADNIFDILFLDIQMEGINGIEAAKILRDKKKVSILIFITGIKEYVFDAFDVSAFHYLLKLVEEKKFSEVFARALTKVRRKKEQEEVSFFVKSKGRTVVLDRNDILYIESQNRMVYIYTTKEILKLYLDMRDLERQLGKHLGYAGFL